MCDRRKVDHLIIELLTTAERTRHSDARRVAPVVGATARRPGGPWLPPPALARHLLVGRCRLSAFPPASPPGLRAARSPAQQRCRTARADAADTPPVPARSQYAFSLSPGCRPAIPFRLG